MIRCHGPEIIRFAALGGERRRCGILFSPALQVRLLAYAQPVVSDGRHTFRLTRNSATPRFDFEGAALFVSQKGAGLDSTPTSPCHEQTARLFGGQHTFRLTRNSATPRFDFEGAALFVSQKGAGLDLTRPPLITKLRRVLVPTPHFPCELLKRRTRDRRRAAVRAVAYDAALIAEESALTALPHYRWQTYDRVSLKARASANCRSRRTAGICEVVAALGCRHRSCVGNLWVNQ